MSLGPLMIDLQGVSLLADEKELLKHPQIGGVIFFSRNYENTSQLRQLVDAIRTIRSDLLLAVDQEGGRVQRFREGFTQLPSFKEFTDIYQKSPDFGLKRVETFANRMAKELIDFDIDFSFAPVLDMDRGFNTVIGDRSFGSDIDTICKLGRAFIEGMHCAGMATVGKHFPGHGHVNVDSHFALPVDDRDFESIYQTDMQAFVQLHRYCTALMPAHILFAAVDQHPVCFSSIWLQDILRKKLHYQGAIISDDLSMGGAQQEGTCLERVNKALEAGCDLVLLCNDRQNVIEVLSHLNYKTSMQSEIRLKAMRRKVERILQ